MLQNIIRCAHCLNACCTCTAPVSFAVALGGSLDDANRRYRQAVDDSLTAARADANARHAPDSTAALYAALIIPPGITLEITGAGREALALDTAYTETVREHVANALQIVNCRGLAPLAESDLTAIDSRLRRALALLDGAL